jgi:hypothetical protein
MANSPDVVPAAHAAKAGSSAHAGRRATSTSFDELLDGFVAALGDTLRKEAPLHRLWYDLRAQSLFEEASAPMWPRSTRASSA